MAAIEEILARAKPRVEIVTICLNGELRAEHARLSTELELLLERKGGKMTGSGSGEARAIAERVTAVEAEATKSMQEFQFKGISEANLEELRTKFPPREGKRETWNVSAAGPALVAACAVDPAMSEAQAAMLCKSLAQGDWDTLVEAAWTATSSRDQSVPFSVRASALTAVSAAR